MPAPTTAPHPVPAHPGPPGPPPRDAAARKADVLRMLETERHLWLASASTGRPHLIPIAYAWDGTRLVVLTRRATRTVRNLRRTGRARVAIGTTRDVVLIDAAVTLSEPAQAGPELSELLARLPLDPARVPGAIVVHLAPQRIQTWRGLAEMAGRIVLDDGVWCL